MYEITCEYYHADCGMDLQSNMKQKPLSNEDPAPCPVQFCSATLRHISTYSYYICPYIGYVHFRYSLSALSVEGGNGQLCQRNNCWTGFNQIMAKIENPHLFPFGRPSCLYLKCFEFANSVWSAT